MALVGVTVLEVLLHHEVGVEAPLLWPWVEEGSAAGGGLLSPAYWGSTPTSMLPWAGLGLTGK